MELHALVKEFGEPEYHSQPYGGAGQIWFRGESVEKIADQVVVRCREDGLVVKSKTPEGCRFVLSASTPIEQIRNEIAEVLSDGSAYFIGWRNYPGPQPVNLASVRGARLPAINVGGIFHCECGLNKAPRKEGKAIRSYWKVVRMVATEGYVCPSCCMEWRGVKVHPSTLQSWKKSHPDVDWEALRASGGILTNSRAG